MIVLRFLPVALVILLAGATAVLLATAHLVVGTCLGALCVALAGLVVWAHLAARVTDQPAPYVEHETSSW